MLRLIGVEQEPFVGPLHEQDYARGVVAAFRKIRNALAHGEVILKPNVSWEFLAVRDLINQLFPVADTSRNAWGNSRSATGRVAKVRLVQNSGLFIFREQGLRSGQNNPER